MPDYILAYRMIALTMLSVEWKKKNHPDFEKLANAIEEMIPEIEKRSVK